MGCASFDMAVFACFVCFLVVQLKLLPSVLSLLLVASLLFNISQMRNSKVIFSCYHYVKCGKALSKVALPKADGGESFSTG